MERSMIVGKESVQRVKQQLEGNIARAHARKHAQGKRQLEGRTTCEGRPNDARVMVLVMYCNG